MKMQSFISSSGNKGLGLLMLYRRVKEEKSTNNLLYLFVDYNSPN